MAYCTGICGIRRVWSYFQPKVLTNTKNFDDYFKREQYFNGAIEPVRVHFVWGIHQQDLSKCGPIDVYCLGRASVDEGFDLSRVTPQMELQVGERMRLGLIGQWRRLWMGLDRTRAIYELLRVVGSNRARASGLRGGIRASWGFKGLNQLLSP